MNPFLQSLIDYLKIQVDVIDPKQLAVLLIYKLCRQQDCRSLKEVCEKLAGSRFINLAELRNIHKKGVISSNIIDLECSVNENENNKTRSLENVFIKKNKKKFSGSEGREVISTQFGTIKNEKFILVCQLVVNKTNQIECIYLCDATDEIKCTHCCKNQMSLKMVDEILLLTSFNFVRCDDKISNSYIEIMDFINVQLKAKTSCTDNLLLHVFKPSHVYNNIKKKLIHLEGEIIAKSQILKLAGRTPFYLIRLRDKILSGSSFSSVSVVVVVQGHDVMHWHSFMFLRHEIRMTDVRYTIMNKGTDEERKIICTSKTSTFCVCKEMVQSINEKICDTSGKGFGQTISYSGYVTGAEHAEFGLYYLDTNITLVLSYQSMFGNLEGFRVGALVDLYNVHYINYVRKKGTILLCACVISTVDIDTFSPSETLSYSTYSPTLAALCRQLNWNHYLLIIQNVIKVKDSFQTYDWTDDLVKRLFEVYKNTSAKYLNKTSLLQQFIDTPHSCVFTQTLNESVPIETMGVTDLDVWIGQITKSQNSSNGLVKVHWLHGHEFQNFESEDDQRWYYGLLRNQDLGENMFLVGILEPIQNPKFIVHNQIHCLRSGDKDVSITITSSFDLKSYDHHLILLKRWFLIMECFTYYELDKHTRKTTGKKLTKKYLFVENERDIFKLSRANGGAGCNSDCDSNRGCSSSAHGCSGGGIVGCGSLVSAANGGTACSNLSTAGSKTKMPVSYVNAGANKRIKLAEDYREKDLAGVLLAREFKRSYILHHDVEKCSNDVIYIPSLGRVERCDVVREEVSLYPFTTSVLILKVIDTTTNRTVSIYIDSNCLQYFHGLLPGAHVLFTKLEASRSKNNNVYYKMKNKSSVTIQEFPPTSFDGLKKKINFFNEKLEENIKSVLIGNEIDKHFRQLETNNDVLLFCGHINTVLYIVVKWTCVVCQKDFANDVCSHGCISKKKFVFEMRCVVDDGTGECYLNINGYHGSRILNIGTKDYDAMKEVSFKKGVISYSNTLGHTYEKSLSRDCTKNSSKLRQYRELLKSSTKQESLYKKRKFYCKPLKRSEGLQGDLRTSVVMGGSTQYEVLCHRKLFYQCVNFKEIEYREDIMRYLATM